MEESILQKFKPHQGFAEKTQLFQISSCWIILIIIMIYLALSAVSYMKDPPVWPDEAIYTDIAENIRQTGQVKTNLFQGAIYGLEKQANWYPPLYFYLQASWIRMFDSSIESVRILSIILGGGCLILFYLLINQLFFSKLLSFLGTLLLLSDYSFYRSSHFGRMEIQTLFFILLSLFILIKAFHNLKYLFLSGLAAGLAFLSHPQGLLALSWMGIYLLVQNNSWKEKIKQFLIIFLGWIIPLIIWLSTVSLPLFISQIQLQLGRKYLEPLYLLINLQTNSIWLILTIVNFLILIMVAFYWRNILNRFLLLITAVSLLAIWIGKEGWYLMYLAPVFILNLISLMKRKEQVKFTPFLILTVIIFLTANWILTIQNWQKWGASSEKYHLFTREIDQKLPTTGKILLSSIPDPYFDLRNGQRQLLEFIPIPISDTDHQKLFQNTDYVVLNYLPNLYLKNYLEKNTENIEILRTNPSVQIIKLKPVNQRI